ncbi:hypothetical protein VTN77DRAFT_5479 [Rasamsonia byssochlamydoides]|uniref:uncharacterized protein n=1 Tax=Rasamsonia byssochlamydoides TaxID=89139 RepID=UPI0037422206
MARKCQILIQRSVTTEIHVFVYDLRHFRERLDSRTRLEQVVDVLYLGTPYFQAEESELLKNMVFVVDDQKTLAQYTQESLEERLNRRMKKRVRSGDFRVRAAHDLAPIFEKALEIHPRKLAHDEGFLQRLENGGLDPGDKPWKGLQKKSFHPKKKSKGRVRAR